MRKSHFNDEFLVLLGPIISRLFTCSNEEKKLKTKNIYLYGKNSCQTSCQILWHQMLQLLSKDTVQRFHPAKISLAILPYFSLLTLLKPAYSTRLKSSKRAKLSATYKNSGLNVAETVQVFLSAYF
jgi:hypothetical protein